MKKSLAPLPGGGGIGVCVNAPASLPYSRLTTYYGCLALFSSFVGVEYRHGLLHVFPYFTYSVGINLLTKIHHSRGMGQVIPREADLPRLFPRQ